MSMFTLAISCLTTSNLPWFVDLTFQVPMQYCSLQHQTLLPSPVTSTTGCRFGFGSLFILSRVISPLISSSILGTYRPGEFTFQCPMFLPFILFMGFSRQEYCSGLPFPSPVDHILSELYTMTHLSWVALHSMAHSFIELDKAVVHVIKFVSFLWLWFQSVCPLMSSLSAYCLTGFVLPWMWGISSRLLASPAPRNRYSKFSKPDFSNTEPWTSRCSIWF